jgi:hypothetical protein
MPMPHNVDRARNWRAHWATVIILVLAVLSVALLVLSA